MLTIALIIIQITTSFLGIYFFDYQIDGRINQIGVILLSLLVGFILMLMVLEAYIEILYYVFKKTPKNNILKHKLANQMVSIPLHLTRTKIVVIGKEHLPKDYGFTIYSNHTSLMDIPLFMYGFNDYPIAFLAKKRVKDIFSVGKWVEALGGVMIDRSNTRKGAEAILQVIKHVKNGSTMVIFPEGTRNKEQGKLLPFKDGAFKVALKSKAPLVPMTIVKEEKKNWPRKNTVTIVVHKALSYEEIKDMKSQELSNKVKELILSAF